GSYNWTWSAENRNDENVIVLMSRSLAKSYEKEFQRVWSTAS
ncbi:MAG: phospholipase D family protein, partial [Thaumarchaeota archaeon]